MDPLLALTEHVQGLSQLVHELAQRVHQHETTPVLPSVAVPPSPVEPRVQLPDRFSGDRKLFVSFRESCRLYFHLRPHSSGSESQRVGIIISRLQGDPQEWAFSLPPAAPELSSVDIFFSALGLLYDEPDRTAFAESQLGTLRQGRRPVEEYCAEFRKWCVASSWNDSALRYQFRLGLSDALKDLLVSYPSPDSLDQVMTLAVRLDRRIRERRQERSRVSIPAASPRTQVVSYPGTSPDYPEEPMQVGATVSPKDRREFRRKNGLCFYCGEADHQLSACSRRKAKVPEELPRLSDQRGGHLGAQVFPVFSSKVLLPVQVSFLGKSVSGSAFIDSGSAANFISLNFALSAGLPLVNLPCPVPLVGVDSSPLASGHVSQSTPGFGLMVGAIHSEECSMFVLQGLPSDVLLGLPWLRMHNPIFDWETGELVKWGKKCMSTCISTVRVSLVEEGNILPEFIQDFRDVFSKKASEELPPHRVHDCAIDLVPGAKLPKGRIFNLSCPEREAMREYIQESLAKGFIRPSTSPVGAGFFFVGKKDGGLRPCIDYRQLNKITVKNQHPLPLIPDLFNQVQGAQWFSKFDLRGAYNLIRIRKGDEWKTAFNTPEGHFEYLVMPFGLSNAPAVFQTLVNDIFRNYLGVFLVVYLDDILVFSKDWVSHTKHVRTVLQILRENNLFAKVEKCVFGAQEMPFLGHILTPNDFRMDPAKVQAVAEWVRPASLKALQRFLGFSNYYRRFIQNFSVIAKPLTDLTRKGADLLHWSPEAVQAFETLKGCFTSAPVLVQPDQTEPFVVEVDASEVGVGAVLSQGSSSHTHLRPCAFFSRKFSPTERNYDVGNRELLAIKWALEEWRHFLEGARHRVTVLTDHKNLVFLESARRLNPRQARWALFFTRFNFIVTFRPGSKNVKADALSRSFLATSPPEVEPEGILPPGIVVSSIDTDLTTEVRAHQDSAPEALPQGKLFVPLQLRLRLLCECHDSVLSGHPGISGTRDLISRSFWWPGLLKDVRAYIASCETCARSKTSRSRPAGLLCPLPVPHKPWTHLAMDFITDLPVSQGKSVVWVVIDRFSKMVHFIPLKKLPSAKDLVGLFIKHILRLHGIPLNIVSDRGVQFVSLFWRAFCKFLGVELSFSSAFHPETNGQTERANQSLEQYLRCFVADSQDEWVSYLALAEFALNNRVSSSSGVSPFFCNYGFNLRFSSFSPCVSDNPEVEVVGGNLGNIWDQVQKNLGAAQDHQRLQANKRRSANPGFLVGDWVWLSSKNLHLKVPSKKFAPRYIGPYQVTEVINPVSFRLKLPSSFRVHNVFHSSLLKKYSPPLLTPKKPPVPVLTPEGLEFEVSKVLDSRRVQGSLQYLVHWKGYGPEERMWVPARDVHARTLIKDFHKKFPDKPGSVVEGPVAPRKRGGTVMYSLPAAPSVSRTSRVTRSGVARPGRLRQSAANRRSGASGQSKPG